MDSNVWLHQFASRHASDVVLRQDYQRVVSSFIARARKLLEYDATLIFVFDGASTPAKQMTAEERAERRARAVESTARQEGDLELDSSTKQSLGVAAGAHVKWPMQLETIKELRKCGFSYVVAPYEADPQLAYMARRGVVDVVLTVDSDLIALGTPVTVLNVNYYSGDCFVVKFEDLVGGAYTKPGDAEHVITFARLLHGHSIDAIHLYAVLAGCDYKFTHVHGIGVKGAVRLIDDCGLVLEDIDRKVREKFRDAVPDDWIAQLQMGISCFTDAIVYYMQSW